MIQAIDLSGINLTDLSLSHGYPAFVLYLASLEAAHPDQELDRATHQSILQMKQTIESQGFSSLSLFNGLAGICYSIHAASKNRTRYQKLLKKLDDALVDGLANHYFEPLKEKSGLRLPAYAELWEVVSGIAGIGAYLLLTLEHRDSIAQIVHLLASLTYFISVGPYAVPGWYQPKHYQFTEQDQRLYPIGNFNLGIAHGIAGVLAFLSLAQLKGIYTSESSHAMDRIASWLLEKKEEANGRFYWPNRVPFEKETLSSEQFYREPSMDAWCYGTAGVARTLFLYGKATQKEKIQKEALDAFVSIDTIPSTLTFCHGIAGLLTLTELMETDTGSPSLQKRAQVLREALASYPAEENGGLLDGDIGIRLALLGKDAFAIWTPVFLIHSGGT